MRKREREKFGQGMARRAAFSRKGGEGREEGEPTIPSQQIFREIVRFVECGVRGKEKRVKGVEDRGSFEFLFRAAIVKKKKKKKGKKKGKLLN